MKQAFGTRLTALRTRAGLSQKELAAVIKITPSSLSNYENGIYLPPLDKACILAKELHTSLDYMTGLSDIHLAPELFSRLITEKITFYHIIKLLASLKNIELLEIIRYAEYLKYKRKRSQYTEEPKPLLVADEE